MAKITEEQHQERAVFVGVIKQNDLYVASGFICHQSLYAFTAVGFHGDIDVGKLLLDLPGFVAYFFHRAVWLCQYISFAFALVASAQYRYFILWAEQAYEIFYVRSFTRAAHGNVSYVDDGNTEGTRFQNASVEQGVTPLCAGFVKPAQGGKPFVYADLVAFHIIINNV
jgi:hypothetical protein